MLCHDGKVHCYELSFLLLGGPSGTWSQWTKVVNHQGLVVVKSIDTFGMVIEAKGDRPHHKDIQGSIRGCGK